ncbi:MAG: type II secretion system F family protein [Syntrophaceae bacterium]|jgi:general secretion pathway protein F|nr:type II secretion system F family protein [Syntrophaceae bacterium]
MAEFVYKATNLSGQTVEGSMEGHDEKAVVRSLHQLGYIPVRVNPAAEKGAGSGFSFLPQRVGMKHLLALSQELSTLVAAGLPIDRSLQILASLTKNPKLKGVVQDILKRIREGSSLAEALGNHPRIFSKLYLNMIKAGESGGFLEVILSRLVKYLQSAKEVRDFLVSVMIYPLILTAVSGASIVILVTFVIPRFAKIFSDMGQTIPLPTQIMLTLSQVVRDYWWVGAGVVALAYFSLKAYNQAEERRLRWDRSKLRWPAVGSIIKKVEVARFARTLSTLLQSGVPILSALSLVKEISQNLAVSRAIGNIHDRLREGKAIARTLEETGVFPPLAIHMISVGEETGRMEEMLAKVAETYETDVQTSVKRFVSMLEPLIILVMGAVVGFIVISMLLAIFSINEIPF